MQIDVEFYSLRRMILEYGLDTKDIRPFAVKQVEAYQLWSGTVSDQPAPQPGESFEYMGVKCVCVPDDSKQRTVCLCGDPLCPDGPRFPKPVEKGQ